MNESEVLNCRVQLIQKEIDVFNIEIIGSICAPPDCRSAIAEISVADITDGANKAKPVYTFTEKDQIEYSHPFFHTVNLGKLPSVVTVLPQWVSIAKLSARSLAFPFGGKRNLQFTVSILSQQNNAEIAAASDTLLYENNSLGYIELEESIRLAQTSAIALAFAVAATESKISAGATAIIQNWTKNKIITSKISFLLNKLLAQTFAILPDGTRLYSNVICKKIITAPFKVRCDILELCLRVAPSDGVIAFEQLLLLKNIAARLEIPREKFRSMIENILPIRMYEIDDVEISLGIASDMSNDQLRRQLSREYRKWNARVTSRNPEIETQAENMLKLIAEMRNEHTE